MYGHLSELQVRMAANPSLGTMPTNSSDLKSDQQDFSLLTKLPVEIRLYVYGLALEDILTHIEAFISYATSVYGVKLKFRGALALLLTSKAIRAEFSEGVMPLVAAHCKTFSAHVKMLELDWKMKAMMRGHLQSGHPAAHLRRQRDRELGNARVAMQALSTVKQTMKRTADENVESSNDT